MGELEDEEEEEWERRMMLEAHLDYVYTQNEKPWVQIEFSRLCFMHIWW